MAVHAAVEALLLAAAAAATALAAVAAALSAIVATTAAAIAAAAATVALLAAVATSGGPAVAAAAATAACAAAARLRMGLPESSLRANGRKDPRRRAEPPQRARQVHLRRVGRGQAEGGVLLEAGLPERETSSLCQQARVGSLRISRLRVPAPPAHHLHTLRRGAAQHACGALLQGRAHAQGARRGPVDFKLCLPRFRQKSVVPLGGSERGDAR
mmetsp:Transcript_45205/g.104337  ORF Transcript_45205/g.104337 Transcript_45205/m.104337 type:complete len:214 (-) Transcript_45205:1268-1909(-)